MFGLISFFIGLLGGVASFMAVVLVEGALASFYPNFLFKDNPYYLLVLLIPALVEEGAKTGVAKRLMGVAGVSGVIVGTGLSFGVIEATFAASEVSLSVFLSPLAWVHLIFLGVGYLIAKAIAKKSPLIFVWILISVVLHWGYDILVFTLSH